MSAAPDNSSHPVAAGCRTGFDEVFAPLGRERFLGEHWCSEFVHLRGTAGRFRHLFSWDELNAALESQRLQAPRLRVAQDGKILDESRYSSQLEGGALRVLRSAALTRCLSAGATLIIDQVDEFAPAVRALADDFERVLGSYTWVNVYAGWRTQKGFDLHWDSQDTTILQVEGRKRWAVHRPTRLHPLDSDKHSKRFQPERPTGPTAWEGILESGDVLHLPRGWWHVAYPLDEASLHLTVTIAPPTGQALLEFLTGTLCRHPLVRKNLPIAVDPAARQAQIAELRSLLLEEWDDDLFGRFLEQQDSIARTRPRFRLPDAVQSIRAPMTPRSRIRLALGKRLCIEPGDRLGQSLVSLEDQQWTCQSGIVPALRLLDDRTPRTLGELQPALAEARDRAPLAVFIAALAMAGAVWIEEP